MADLASTPQLETPRVGTPFEVDFDFIQDSVIHMAPLHRPLRSHSNRKNFNLISRPASAAESTNSSTSSGKQLRRVGNLTPPEDISPIIPINVGKEDWLENALIKTKQILLDKESTESFTRRVTASTSTSSLTSFTSSKTSDDSLFSVPINKTNSTKDTESTTSSTRTLSRKKKTTDLRSKFAGTKSPTQEPSLLDDNTPLTCNDFPTLRAQNTIFTAEEPANPDPVVWYDHVSCLCRRAFHPVHGKMVHCEECNEFFHLRCIGLEHLEEHYEEKPFVCAECEECGADGGIESAGMDI